MSLGSRRVRKGAVDWTFTAEQVTKMITDIEIYAAAFEIKPEGISDLQHAVILPKQLDPLIVRNMKESNESSRFKLYHARQFFAFCKLFLTNESSCFKLYQAKQFFAFCKLLLTKEKSFLVPDVYQIVANDFFKPCETLSMNCMLEFLDPELGATGNAFKGYIVNKKHDHTDRGPKGAPLLSCCFNPSKFE